MTEIRGDMCSIELFLILAEFTKHLRKFIDLDDFWKFCSPLIWAVGSTSVLGYMSVPVRRVVALVFKFAHYL